MSGEVGLQEVLAAHDGWSQIGPLGETEQFDLICHGCGEPLLSAIPDHFGEERMDELQRAHLASVLAVVVAKALAEALREAASNLPRERHRGKRNDPATIASIARFLDGLAVGEVRA